MDNFGKVTMSAKDAGGDGKDTSSGVVVKEPSKLIPHPAEASPKEDAKNRGWPKGKKRYPKSPGAPKQPLSGYVHFLNYRRDSVRKECPDMSFAEISKKLAQEWSHLVRLILLLRQFRKQSIIVKICQQLNLRAQKLFL